MEILMILGAFAGGIIGALIGGLPAFILLGFIGLAGLTATGSADLVGVAFGHILGPHIAFGGGGVAAAAYAHRIKKLEAGGDILTPLAKFNDVKILLVGGVFGIAAYMINYLYSIVLVIPTDRIAMTVVTLGIIARFMFGKTGLFGGECPNGNRVFVPTKESVPFLIVMGFAMGTMSSYFAVVSDLMVFGFLLSAASLIFTQMGFPVPGTHHITLVAAYAGAATGSVLIGALFGVIAALVGEFMGNTFNSYCDSHIDPPACTIFVLSLFIFVFL